MVSEGSVLYSGLAEIEIRLLTILPGPVKAPIKCLLRTISLADSPLEYVALSWTWEPKPSKYSSIDVNNVKHAARSNLHDALVGMRDETESRAFWVDAICINQDDEGEKVKQIQLMSEIYSKATHVAVWLGPPAEDSDFVMENLRKGVVPKTSCFYDSTFKILLRPWFGRSWILQEFVLNCNEPHFHVGKGPPIAWSILRQAGLDTLKTGELVTQSRFSGAGTLAVFTKAFMQITILHSARDKYQAGATHGDARSLSHWLYYLKYFTATDPRDKIYGVLGLVGSETLADFKTSCGITYQKSLFEIYHDATMFMLENENNFRAYLHYWTVGGAGSSGPSWVLQFDQPYQPSPAVFLHTHANEFESIQISDDRNRLFMKAILLDTIEETVEIGDFYNGWGCNVGTKSQQILPLTQSQYRKSTAFGIILAVIGNILCMGRQWSGIIRHSEYSLKYIYTIHYISQLIQQRQRQVGFNFELSEPLWKTLTCQLEDSWFRNIPLPKFDEALQLSRNPKDSIAGIIKAYDVHQNGIQFNRKTFFLGKHGFYGRTGVRPKKGDVIALLFPQVFVPFILCRKGNNFELIGPAYLPDTLRDRAVVERVETLYEITTV